MKRLRSFFSKQDGSTFIIVALGIMALVGAVGTAVDVGRGQMLRTKLQNSLDAAGLAAGASGSVDTATLNAIVTKYMNINFTGGMQGATLTSTTATLSADQLTLTVNAYASMPTTFMKVFGRTTMNIHSTTEVTRANKGLELAMVLDVTGSMLGSKLTTLKQASNDLLTTLFGTGTTGTNLWIGIVPFSQAVNVGNTHDDWIEPVQDHNSLDWGPGGDWGGCVDARYDTGNDVTAVTPATDKFLAYYWADTPSGSEGGAHAGDMNWIDYDVDSSWVYICHNQNSCKCANYGPCGTVTTGDTKVTIACSGSGSGRDCTKTTDVTTADYNIVTTGSWQYHKGPNTWCPTPITPLTNVKATLTAAIDALVAKGYTHIPEGAAWGWRLLDPDWKTAWGGTMESNGLPLAYNTPLMLKAVILMTDGTNTMNSKVDGAYGYPADGHLGTTDVATAEGKLDDKLKAICTAMKAKNIVVYTVLFEENDANIVSMLTNCATEPDYFFKADNEAALLTAFQSIGGSLANLRISK